MVFHKVWVLHQVNRLQSQLAQALATIHFHLDLGGDAAAAGLCTPVAVHTRHRGLVCTCNSVQRVAGELAGYQSIPI